MKSKKKKLPTHKQMQGIFKEFRTANDLKHARTLCGQEKPTIEQVAWVFAHLLDHMKEGGSYRYLIYTQMGFSFDAYCTLYFSGGMDIHNHLSGVLQKYPSL